MTEIETVEYYEGYRKALIDLHKWIEKAETGLKLSRINNAKGVLGCIGCILDNQDVFLSQQEDLTIYFQKNGKKMTYSVTPPKTTSSTPG